MLDRVPFTLGQLHHSKKRKKISTTNISWERTCPSHEREANNGSKGWLDDWPADGSSVWPPLALKQMLSLDESNPDSHRCLIRFFHQVSSFKAPVTDSEKLVCDILKAERLNISQFHGKSLAEANQSFLEEHKGSLMHRTAAAEMLYVLNPDKKLEAVKLIEDSANSLVDENGVLGLVREWKVHDCIAVHALLERVFKDSDAASRWGARCADYFTYSTHFGGRLTSAAALLNNHNICDASENGHARYGDTGESQNFSEKLENIKDIKI